MSKRIKQSWTFYHRFLGVCNCTKKLQRQQTWRIRNCRYLRSQTQINKIPVKHCERPRWNSKNITLTLKYFHLENNGTSLLLTTYKCRSTIYKKYYMSELALHKSLPSHFSQLQTTKKNPKSILKYNTLHWAKLIANAFINNPVSLHVWEHSELSVPAGLLHMD